MVVGYELFGESSERFTFCSADGDVFIDGSLLNYPLFG